MSDDLSSSGESVAGSAASPPVPRLQKQRTDGEAASFQPAAIDRAAGIGKLTKRVGAGGRVSWVLQVGPAEITMTTRQLLSARQAEKKIYAALIDLGFYDALPDPMPQKEWERTITAKITALATPCGRARTTDAAWCRPPWWRRTLLSARRLLRAA